MKLLGLAHMVGLFVAAAGCDGRGSRWGTNEGEGGIHIQWPGGSVQVDPNTGATRVKTKNVEVDAGLRRGAHVRTPKVNVDADAQGVDVNAPGVEVDVKR